MHGARKHTSTRFTVFVFLLLASIYRNFNNLFAGRAAVFTAAIEWFFSYIGLKKWDNFCGLHSYLLLLAMAALRYGGPEPYLPCTPVTSLVFRRVWKPCSFVDRRQVVETDDKIDHCVCVCVLCVCDTEARDPCATMRCYFGAQCVPSADLLTGTCQCPSANDTECSANEPVCGDDMIDYRNVCHLQTASCQRRRYITVKYRGKCGTFSLTYLLIQCQSFVLVAC